MTFINDSEQIKNQIKNTIIFQFINSNGNSLVPLRSLLLDTKYGFTASAKETGTVRLVRITDIQSGHINWASVSFCECDAPEDYLLQDGDILVARTGGTVGKSFLISGKIENAVFASYLIRLRVNKQKALPKFISYFLNSYLYWSQITNLKSGSAQPNVNAEKLKELMVPYCDIITQTKIIKLIENKETENTTFVNLGNILTGTIQDYERIEEFSKKNSDLINYTSKLRQAILQEAVSGKLVPQDPKDEPASELLKRIKAEKEKLIKEKKIKKEKEIPPISNDKIPYGSPKGWAWVRLNELGYFTGGGTPSTNKSEYWNGDILWVSPKDMKSDLISDSELKISDEALANSAVKMIPEGSILIVARSGILKRTLPVSINEKECTVNQDIKVLIPFVKETNMYLRIMLKGFESFILTHLVKEGMTVQSLEYEKFENQLFPIPPLAEQMLIVDKVNELMKLCNELGEKIKDNQNNSELLMEAVLKEAFASFT